MGPSLTAIWPSNSLRRHTPDDAGARQAGHYLCRVGEERPHLVDRACHGECIPNLDVRLTAGKTERADLLGRAVRRRSGLGSSASIITASLAGTCADRASGNRLQRAIRGFPGAPFRKYAHDGAHDTDIASAAAQIAAQFEAHPFGGGVEASAARCRAR